MNKIIISAPWTVHPPIVRLTPALKINFTSQSNKTQFNSFCYRLVLRNVLIQTVHKSKKKNSYRRRFDNRYMEISKRYRGLPQTQ